MTECNNVLLADESRTRYALRKGHRCQSKQTLLGFCPYPAFMLTAITYRQQFSIDDLKDIGTSKWDGVRNHEAKKIMKEKMKIGDKVSLRRCSPHFPQFPHRGPRYAQDYATDTSSNMHRSFSIIQIARCPVSMEQQLSRRKDTRIASPLVV